MVSGRLKPEARFRLTNRFSYLVRRLCKREFITACWKVLIESRGAVAVVDRLVEIARCLHRASLKQRSVHQLCGLPDRSRQRQPR